MALSLTDSLLQDRLTVVSVDKAAGLLRVKAHTEACTDLACADETLVASDEGTQADLGTLNPGDIVKLEGPAGRPQRIVVVRRVWEEMTSPEW
jgi:hypothetical protein